MSAESLGTLATIYAIGELQNTTMLCEGDMNLLVEVVHFYITKGFDWRFNIV